MAAVATRRYPKLATRGWVNNNTELKYVDTALTALGVNTTGSISALNLIAQGDESNTRDGRQVCCKSIHVQGFVRTEDQTTEGQLARLMLVWDSQPNSGVIATIALILTSATAVAHTNLDNRERFTVLRDLRFPLGQVSDVATQAYAVGPGVHDVNVFLDLKGVKTTYSGTTATIGVVATGALLWVQIGTAAAGSACTFSGQSRLRFTDM